LVNGSVTIGGSTAPNGTQVFAKMTHATLGDCWTSVQLTSNGNYSMAISPPGAASQWLNLTFYISGYEADASAGIPADAYFPGFTYTINLSLPEATAPAPTGPLTPEPGVCPQRQTSSGAPPSIPTIVTGIIVIDGATASADTQVVAVFNHPVFGQCWTPAAIVNAGGGYTLLVNPPSIDPNWFPMAFYINGQLAISSNEVTQVKASPGATITNNLTLATEPAETPTPTPDPSATPTPGAPPPPPPPPPPP
jgi:hypothetical protein